MKNLMILLVVGILFTACKKEEPLMTVTYPETKKVDTVDVYFNTKVNDPYRWLEDDRSEETGAWVKAQNEVTFGYLNAIPFKNELKNRLEQIWNFEKVGSPFKEGNYTYFYKNDGLQNQYVLYRQKENEKVEVFLDPNTFSNDGTISLGEMDFSNDGSLVAYSISEGGSDWRKIIVLNTETKEIVGDTINDVKFTRISWKGNDGFYYSSYEKPKGSELSAKTDQHKLYYHKLGTKQKEDKVIFGGIESQKRRYVGGSVTDDDRFLFISAAESTSGNELYMLDLQNPKSKIIQITTGFENDHSILENDGDKLYIVTNLNAP
ncbi:MAG TPA: S9 family peptidase, partial [Flavobacteriaceae bacterium]|nr:S9 family peptidase [Flavobacteriaceae bacterium]